MMFLNCLTDMSGNTVTVPDWTVFEADQSQQFAIPCISLEVLLLGSTCLVKILKYLQQRVSVLLDIFMVFTKIQISKP